MKVGIMSSYKWNRMSRIVVAGAVFIAASAIAGQASASGNQAPVSDASIASWSPAGIKTYDCSNVTWTGLEKYDLYHWVVSPENYTSGSGSTQKKGQWTANFTNGSVDVTYEGGGTANLSAKSFGYSNIASNHLYTAVPAGKKVISAKLNYTIDTTATKGAPVNPPSILNTSHVLSHTCATPYSDPVIDILTVNSSYEEEYTESYSWDLAKTFNVSEGETADSKWFSKGLAPEFIITGTRSGPTIDDSSYALVEGSVVVSGTFSLENATLADASISFSGDNASGLGSADCSTSSTDVVSVFAYVCAIAPTTVDDESPGNILKNLGFTVSGSVNGGNTENVSDNFGDAVKQNLTDTLGGTADIEDNLASLGGSNCDVEDCTFDINGTPVDLTDDVLALKGVTDSFELTYKSNWDWEQAKTTEDCSQTFTNTATLTWSGGKKSAPYSWSTKCPVPTVELNDDVTSSYDVSYNNNFSWSIEKKMLEVDQKTLNAKYEVTATRSGPEVDEVSGTDVIISGTFKTTFASNENVVVTLSFKDQNGNDVVVNCDETGDTYECTIDSGKLSSLGASDKKSGWDGLGYVVNAEVTTAGGSDEVTRSESLGKPDNVRAIDSNKSASVTDDLDGYAATSIECEADGVDCWSGESDVKAGTTLQTLTAEDTIVLKYELKWIGSIELSAEACPTIANKAEVLSGGEKLDDTTNTAPMTCPELVITLSTNEPQYTQTWDTEYRWSIEKKYLGVDVNTWQPKYSVTATRTSGLASNMAIVDESQKVTGTLVLELNPATSIISDPTDVAAVMNLDTDTTECVVMSGDFAGEFKFECTVENESVINAKDGIKDESYQLDWSGSAYGKKVSDSASNKWGVSFSDEIGSEVNKTAVIVDINAAGLEPISISNGSKTGASEVSSSVISSSPYTMSYTLNWQWNNGAGCGMSVSNTAKLLGDESKELTAQKLTNTVNCLKAEPGLTIGYYGNKAGGTEVAKTYKSKWRTSASAGVYSPSIYWNNTLSSLDDFADDQAVRKYMTEANCNSTSKGNTGGYTCRTMFRAQALASTMNAIKSAKFGNQSVLFRGSCTKVTTLLRDALHFTSVDQSTSVTGIQTRIDYKSIFDDLNNSRAARCPNGN